MKFIIPEDQKRYWQAMGRFYGYPQCCIDSFCNRTEFLKKGCIQFRAAKGHGFIPCLECARKVLRGETSLADLVINRSAQTAFPIDCAKQDDIDMRQWHREQCDV